MSKHKAWPEAPATKANYEFKWDMMKPSVEAALKAQGLTSLKQLTHRINWILEQDGIRDSEIFGNMKIDANKISPIISKNNKHSTQATFSSKGKHSAPLQNGFTKTTILIAMALEKDPEALFGPPPTKNDLPVIPQAEQQYFCVPDYSHTIEQHDTKKAIDSIIERALNPKQKETLSRRYGIGEHPSHTNKKIGEEMGCTEGKVAVRLQSASLKLRHRPYVKIRDLYKSSAELDYKLSFVEQSDVPQIDDTEFVNTEMVEAANFLINELESSEQTRAEMTELLNTHGKFDAPEL